MRLTNSMGRWFTSNVPVREKNTLPLCLVQHPEREQIPSWTMEYAMLENRYQLLCHILEEKMLLTLCLLLGLMQPVFGATTSPITVMLKENKDGYATMTNCLHQGNRIGYRFHEHTPILDGDIPVSCEAARIDPTTVESNESTAADQPGVITYSRHIKDEKWIPQRWTYYLAPVEDGVEILWVVETFQMGLPRYHGVQQCFRMSGKGNMEWRRTIAETPAFSEFDLWDLEEQAATPRTSLSYVIRKGIWQFLPAVAETIGARTPLGLLVDMKRSGYAVALMPEVGPYQARMLEPVDYGLVARTDKDQTWICGMYWQHTSHITDHHPADCLHAIVNIGNIPPYSKRSLRGKIYWFKGSLEDLTRHWRTDFGTNEK